MTAITLNLNSIIKLTSEQFYQLCEENPDLKLERSANGELIAMPPTGGETGKRNVKVTTQLDLWNEQTELGEVFDSSTGFTLPNKADRSPDASWVEKSRWSALTPEQREKFIPLCPDFVIELVSPSDSLKKSQEKMQEYMENGCRLGWLINPEKTGSRNLSPRPRCGSFTISSHPFWGKCFAGICSQFAKNLELI